MRSWKKLSKSTKKISYVLNDLWLMDMSMALLSLLWYVPFFLSSLLVWLLKLKINLSIRYPPPPPPRPPISSSMSTEKLYTSLGWQFSFNKLKDILFMLNAFGDLMPYNAVMYFSIEWQVLVFADIISSPL